MRETHGQIGLKIQSLRGDKIKHIRIEVRVDASTSSETSRVVNGLKMSWGRKRIPEKCAVNCQELLMST